MFSFLPSIIGVATNFLKSKSSVLIDIVLVAIMASILFFGYGKYQSMKSTITDYKTQVVKEKAINLDMQSKLHNLQVLNENTIKKLHDAESQYKSNMELMQKKMIQDAKRVKTITVIKERIKYVKPKDDGKVAKVLKDTLEQIAQMDKQ